MERKEKNGRKGIQNNHMVSEGPGMGMENFKKGHVDQETAYPGDASNAAGADGDKGDHKKNQVGSQPVDSKILNKGENK